MNLPDLPVYLDRVPTKRLLRMYGDVSIARTRWREQYVGTDWLKLPFGVMLEKSRIESSAKRLLVVLGDRKLSNGWTPSVAQAIARGYRV